MLYVRNVTIIVGVSNVSQAHPLLRQSVSLQDSMKRNARTIAHNEAASKSASTKSLSDKSQHKHMQSGRVLSSSESGKPTADVPVNHRRTDTLSYSSHSHSAQKTPSDSGYNPSRKLVILIIL